MDEIRFVAATGSLGGGGLEPAYLEQALSHQPHFIAADAGTSDAGPFSLGKGEPAYSREAIKWDLAAILSAGRKAGIPVLVGSAGTAGGDVHVDHVLDIAREICEEQGFGLKTAVIKSDQSSVYLERLYAAGKIRALDPAPEVDAGTFARSERIVGMIGVEPLQDALAAGAEFVLAGRCSDPALYAAMPIAKGFPAGLAWHLGKAVECGTLVCETAGKGVILGRIRADHAVIQPIGSSLLRCTPQSVAAHSLYENSDPYLHKECSGTLDLTHSVFEQMDDGISVKVTGSEFIPAEEFTVKLEGAERAGYQTIIIGGVRDPYIIAELDNWLDGIKKKIEKAAQDVLGNQLRREDYTLDFHIYGRDAVMGPLESREDYQPREVGIVFEATAPTQELATQLAKISRQPLLHHPIDKWKGAITGFACLHNPAYLERGAVYRWNMNHVALPEHHTDMFRTDIVQLGDA